ncbi:outer membrane protein transport protein [Pseudomonas sp. MDMC216]|nr:MULTISPECIES: outer membrane protein transport protein [Pseudomonas]MDP3366920.1 outer membrane protein transport protein [Pseudomonas sp.]ERH48757.1 Ompp1/FadL/TodX family transporter [Pseudomonas chengduensis]MDH1560305.1 outer membrane protein transport protein [Pseudomonas chengduensis]MDH1728932.1 outer membrane protein transport protein [Pseudomonas chengduensis]MDI5994569.1 outer membrane protein transport protein [Pseudomonas sp. MDMC216]
MSKRLLKTGLAVAITATSSHGFASGFALNEQSISGMGTSFAGRSSSADDASTVFGNPAGMARLKRDEVYVGAAAIHAKSDISHASANAGPLALSGSNDGDMVPTTGVPMGYYVKPLDDKVAFGLGVYVPFGLMTDYESSFQGRYYADKSYVRVITVQPTLSYRFNDKLSVGFGPTFNHIEGELTSSVLNPLSPGSNDGKVKVKGDDTAVGFNVGVLYEFTPNTRAGVTYHSRVKYELEGDTRVSGSGALAGIAGKYDANLDLTTPESVDMSITHDLSDALTLYVGSTWTRWSRFKEIRVENDSTTLPANLSTIVEEQNWHDTWAHAVGLSYKVSPQWTLRTGIAIDQSPTNNVDRSPRVPSGDRTIFSVGAGWSPNQDMTIDVAYSYLQEESVDVNHVSATRGTYSARYKNSAHGLGASLSYRF